MNRDDVTYYIAYIQVVRHGEILVYITGLLATSEYSKDTKKFKRVAAMNICPLVCMDIPGNPGRTLGVAILGNLFILMIIQLHYCFLVSITNNLHDTRQQYTAFNWNTCIRFRSYSDENLDQKGWNNTSMKSIRSSSNLQLLPVVIKLYTHFLLHNITSDCHYKDTIVTYKT